ncbi:monocarboxylate transporter 13-like [Scleropages formosus]|uniref:Monocarboxylate transporter 13-like n=1 Tax=Scleropages formosus TaxID=113540 RepID=A0A0P7UAM4_SCLFO|nr:monocarboxylate transporter 13-like [Scleropages formosus]
MLTERAPRLHAERLAGIRRMRFSALGSLSLIVCCRVTPTPPERARLPVGAAPAMVRARSREPVAAPDGGWGWVVVGVLFVTSALVFGLIRSLGVFFVEFVHYFERSAQAISWIASIGVATQQLMTFRKCAHAHLFQHVPLPPFPCPCKEPWHPSLATFGSSLLSLSPPAGVGWALVFTPVVASVMQYFSRRRSLAMGLGFTGVGLSSFAFSPLFQLLVDVYAWRGALLILGALSFNMVACGALIRPLGSARTKSQALGDQADETSCSSLCSRAFVYLELSLLLHKPFVIYTLAVTLFNAGYYVPYIYLVAHSRHVGFSEYQAAFVVSAAGVADLAGRVIAGWTSDLGRTRLPHMLSLWTGLTGLFMLLLPSCSAPGSYGGLLLISLLYGFSAGAMTPLVFSAVPEIVGTHRMLGALGLLQLIESVGGLLGAPLSGWLKDQTGSYTGSFLLAGGCLLLGTLVLAGLPHYFACSPSSGVESPGQNQSPEAGLLTHAVCVPTLSKDLPTSGAENASAPLSPNLDDVQPRPGVDPSALTAAALQDNVGC